MKIGDLVLSYDGFVGVVVKLAKVGNGIGGYAQIYTAPCEEGYVRRAYPARHLEVI